jgi:hypothetical protein
MLIVRVFLLLGYEEGKDLQPLEETNIQGYNYSLNNLEER